MAAQAVKVSVKANIAVFAILRIDHPKKPQKPHDARLKRIQHWPHEPFSHILAGLVVWISLLIEVHGAQGYDSCTACER
jgi:hypothetical protein